VPGAKSESIGGRQNDHVRQPARASAAFLRPQPQPDSAPTWKTVEPAARTLNPTKPVNRHAEIRVATSKRFLDTACIFVCMPLILPLALFVGLYIKVVSPGPVFFRQERVGYRERRFQVLKFRSMRVNANPQSHESHTTHLLKSNLPLTKMDESGDDRLIPLGRLLRSSGLDELPQLVNVLRGEMSIVGPRPCTNYEFDLLDQHQKSRFRALPGMTGLWQVSGKNKTTFQQMIDLDAAYADHWSLSLDLQIIARTIPVICRQVTEVLRSRMTEVRGQGTEVRGQRTEDRGGAENRGQRSEVRRQRIEDRISNIDLRPPSP
jgi:exopolysaccharide production protein ExoY